MPITETQRELRRKSIGSSDSPAILGLSPWGSPGSVYDSKVHAVDPPASHAMDGGNRLEQAILDWLSEETGVKFRANQRRVWADDNLFAANCDGLSPTGPAGAEIKTDGIIGWGRPDEWGEPLTDEIPVDTVIQVQHQMLCAGLEVVHVGALLHRRGFVRYVVRRDDELIGQIVEAGRRFWADHVMPKVPPDSYTPNMEVLRRIVRTPGSEIALPDDADGWVRDWEQMRERRLTFEKAEQEAQAQLVDLLGDAEVGVLEDGRQVCFVAEGAGRRVDIEALKRDGLYETYSSPATRRVLRIKKPRKALT